jgi:threonyl-tRNA synthetase
MTEPATVTITLPDGTHKDVASGTTVADFVRTQIGTGLAKAALFARYDGADVDLTRSLDHSGALAIFTPKNPEGLDLVRHDAAHIVASVVQRLFPGTQVTIGPTTEDGFYYDFARDQPFTPEDLETIEKAANEEVKNDLPFVRKEVSRDEALALFGRLGEKFKLEIIEDIFAKGARTLSLYSHGDWVDFCLGPHGPSTGRVGVIKLLSVAGAYWRGDHRNAQLQRIYGTAFFTQKELDAWLHQQEEARKRDHRKLGKELGLFMFHPLAPASPFFLPKGAQIYNGLITYLRGLYREHGYQEVVTPQIFDVELWKISGHYDNYRENMYFTTAEEREFGVKPMNCPSHALMFGSRIRSYRELPLRFADFGRLHRFERSGVVSGLTRVRSFSQDDGHTFLAPEMIGDEIERCFLLQRRIYKDLGLSDPKILVGTRPDKSIGSDEVWKKAEALLFEALKRLGQEHVLNAGDGAFYGPKLDFQVRDAIGRAWQLATIQLDFNLAERFDLHYSAHDGTMQRPVVIHRAILGSLERFIGVYLEHTGGHLPLWLAPVQVKVLTVAADFVPYAKSVAEKLEAAGFRVELDDRSEKIGAKVRDGALEKIPYLLVIGARERDGSTVAVRERSAGDQGAVAVDAFVARLKEQVAAHG